MRGLETLYLVTHQRRYKLKVDLQDFEGVSVFAQYSLFSVEPETEGYKLHISGFINKGVGDSLEVSNGQKFSTFDKDQDMNVEGNCARSYPGAFWYNNCNYANPNRIYLWGQNSSTPFAIRNVSHHWKGYHQGLGSISMKIRRVA